jgi:hypothetical protein
MKIQAVVGQAGRGDSDQKKSRIADRKGFGNQSLSKNALRKILSLNGLRLKSLFAIV